LNAKSIIRRKRDGARLDEAELRYLVQGAISGSVSAYQLTAWMMAVFFQGMDPAETAALTVAMLESGDRLDFGAQGIPPADKHSTGGVGDKISFLVAPLVASLGVPVPMVSGRSLGHTGGTLDKLESIPGLRTGFEPGEIRALVERIGFCFAGQSKRIAPADAILYALRDASSIVESIPLITASILSKKAAAGVRSLALDVKVGEGAFMPGLGPARDLARSLIATAEKLGIRACAHLTEMDRVLGRTAGNALEIAESCRCLRNEAVPDDLRELTLSLGASMCVLSGRAADREEGHNLLLRAWQAGQGYDRFLRMVEAQGGNPRALDGPGLLPVATRHLEVPAPEAGIFRGVRARPAGEWITEAGGGRLRTDDRIDPRVGIEILAEPGSRVERGETVLLLHLGDKPVSEDAAGRASRWIQVDDASSAAGAPAGASRARELERIDRA
jgi:pyrimidine-nucleoside phosphorylase